MNHVQVYDGNGVRPRELSCGQRACLQVASHHLATSGQDVFADSIQPVLDGDLGDEALARAAELLETLVRLVKLEERHTRAFQAALDTIGSVKAS